MRRRRLRTISGNGLPFREAHWTAGRLVAMLAREGRPLSSASLEELRGLSPLFAEDYYSAVELDRVVAAKVSPGGTAPPRVAEQLALARDRLKHVAAEIDLQVGYAEPAPGGVGARRC